MKKPIALISNDWHLEENNIGQVTHVILQKIEYWLSLADTNIRFICLGDVFDSRKSQKETTLLAFNRILDTLQEMVISTTCTRSSMDTTDISTLQLESISFLPD